MYQRLIIMPGASTMPLLEEDELLETANDSGFKHMFELTSNLPAFCI